MKTLLLLTIILVMISNQVRTQTVSDLIDGYYAYNRFWGSVLVSQHGKIILQKSYGFADKDREIKNGDETLFFLASVTKTITATAIFKLHDEGKLSVFDRVDKYIPGFVDDKTDSLTILNLLNHTSGMSANLAHSDDLSKEAPKDPGHEIQTLDQLIDSYRGTKLKNKPGEKWDYNNYGYILLAYIIEKASGMDYLSYLQKAIFSESGMTLTTDQKDLPRQPAVGYTGIGTDSIFPVKDETYPAWFKGAVGLYSSTNDLYKFLRSVFTCRLFPRQTLNLMLDTCISTHKGNLLWTAGWQKSEIDGHDFYSHGGSAEGFSTIAGYMPDDDITITILSNLVRDCSGGQSSASFSYVDEIAGDIIKILHGKSVACLPLPKGKATGNPAGHYRLDESHYMNVSYKNDSLLLLTNPAGSFTLFDYNLYREINDTARNYLICKEFTSSLLANNFGGFGKYATEEMQKGTFNDEFHASLMNFWEKVVSHDGQYVSSNIYEKETIPYGEGYKLAFHFERSEMIMQLFFDQKGLVSGFFVLKILPKCNVTAVNLIPVGNDEYFVDGIRAGGYKDINVSYDRKSGTLNFRNEDGIYTALRTDHQ